MPTRLSDEEFTARFDLADWRVESGRLEVVYRLQTYEAAATLVLDIATRPKRRCIIRTSTCGIPGVCTSTS